MAKDNPENLIQRGKVIREIRESKHVTASELARYINISRKSYERIESGERDMRCFEAMRIATFLNVHLYKILNHAPKPIVSSRTQEIALASGFHNWEIGHRFQNFANEIVKAVQS